MTTLLESEVPGARLWRRGKVRDVYEAGGDRLVMIASDRLSAFDVVFPTPIPDKGRVLTQMSNFWFKRLEDIVPNHLVSADLADFPRAFREVTDLVGRAVLVKRCERIDVECVARGYISAARGLSTRRSAQSPASRCRRVLRSRSAWTIRSSHPRPKS